MAGGYQHRPRGVEGFAAVLADLQRQINALRATAPLTSAVIGKGGITVTGGGGLTLKDLGSLVAEYPNGEAAVFFGALVPPELYKSGLLIQDEGGGAFFYAATLTDGTNRVSSGADEILFDSPRLLFYGLPTTSSAANLRLDVVDGEPLIKYVTSSARYKDDIEDLDVDVDAFLALRPRTWRDKADGPDSTRRHVGFIAEEVDDLGLPFVDYDDQGRPDALQYDRFMTGAVRTIQAQQDQIDALTRRLDALDSTPEDTP